MICHSPVLWPAETQSTKLCCARIYQCFRSNRVLYESTSSLQHFAEERRKKEIKEGNGTGRENGTETIHFLMFIVS